MRSTPYYHDTPFKLLTFNTNLSRLYIKSEVWNKELAEKNEERREGGGGGESGEREQVFASPGENKGEVW